MPPSDELKNSLLNSPNKWVVERIDCIDSTNSELARRFSCSDTVPYLLLWAEEQVSGRGRLQRKWFSCPGMDITASVIFPSPVERSCVHKLVLPAGLALTNILRDTYGLNALVRWPNDVLVGGKKIAGILCSYLAAPDAVICGIGINVNSNSDDLAVDTFTPGTTVFAESGKETSRHRLLGLWLLEFENLWRLAKDENFEILSDKFNSVNFYKGMRVKIFPDAASTRDRGIVEKSGFTGIAGNLNSVGTLIINLDNGALYAVKIDDVIIPI
ncbi:MAG: biotin--[acetyl-CoA-carboxylase] ligase [bacterium]|nr:biotin--[acetyl-CoA-carboxylase] ligase [bacterium]